MAISRRLDPQKRIEGDRLLSTFFGDKPGKTVYHVFEQDMRGALAEDAQSLEPHMPEKMDVNMNGRLIEDYEGDKSRLIEKRMNFGTRARFSSARISIDLKKPASWIYSQLLASSPIFSGKYRKSHVFTIESRAVGGNLFLPPNSDIVRVGVTNLTSYASTLENPGWHRIYQKVFGKAKRKWSKDYDLKLSFINGDLINGDKSVRGTPYYHPHLEVAPIGYFRGDAGRLVYTKRRSIRKRRPPIFR